MCRAGAFDVRILFFFLRVRIAPGSAEGGHQIHDVLRVVEVHGRGISIDGAFHVGELIGECIGVVTGFDDFGFAGGSVCDFCFPGTRVLHDLDKSVLTGNHAAFRLFGVERASHLPSVLPDW